MLPLTPRENSSVLKSGHLCWDSFSRSTKTSMSITWNAFCMWFQNLILLFTNLEKWSCRLTKQPTRCTHTSRLWRGWESWLFSTRVKTRVSRKVRGFTMRLRIWTRSLCSDKSCTDFVMIKEIQWTFMTCLPLRSRPSLTLILVSRSWCPSKSHYESKKPTTNRKRARFSHKMKIIQKINQKHLSKIKLLMISLQILRWKYKNALPSL